MAVWALNGGLRTRRSSAFIFGIYGNTCFIDHLFSYISLLRVFVYLLIFKQEAPPGRLLGSLGFHWLTRGELSCVTEAVVSLAFSQRHEVLGLSGHSGWCCASDRTGCLWVWFWEGVSGCEQVCDYAKWGLENQAGLFADNRLWPISPEKGWHRLTST